MVSKTRKEVYIDGVKVMYGTSIKASPETNLSTTATFDGTINQGSEDIPWSIEVSKLRYGGLQEHKQMNQILNEMLTVPKQITICEKVITKTETFTITDHFHGCLVDGNDYELKPDDHTVENLKFKAESKDDSIYE